MPCELSPESAIRRRRTKLVLFALMVLSACAASQGGVQSNARTKYGSIAVVPRVTDRLITVYRQGAYSEPVVSQAAIGWDAAGDAGKISQDLLGRAGASVSVTSSPGSAAARAADAVIVLQQTPLDQFARRYAPGQDLMISAASVLGAASAGGMFYIIVDDKRRYSPRTILEIRGPEGGGPNHCAIGITPSLIDASSGETVRKGRSLLGVEKIPSRISGRAWQQLTPAERSTVLTYCQSALRRAISQSMSELGVVN